MLLALDDSGTCATLQSCLKEGTKTYMALLRGYWHHTSDTLTVDSPIDGKVAITRFTKLATHIGTTNHGTTSNNSTFSKYPPDACTLVACTLEQTGRTHQIRRHAASVLHQPVMGDTQHGDSKINRWWRTERGLNRLALHCLALDLPAPTTLHPPTYMMDNDYNTPAQLDAIQSEQTDRIQITAPLPPDLTSVFQHPEMSDFWRQATQNEPRLSMDPVDLRGGSHGRKYKQKLTTSVEE
jgi:tRNA pseudouridine65 synthase